MMQLAAGCSERIQATRAKLLLLLLLLLLQEWSVTR